MGFNSGFKGLTKDYSLNLKKISLIQSSHYRNASTDPLWTCHGSIFIREAHSGIRCVRALYAKNTADMRRFLNAMKTCIYVRGLVSCFQKITFDCSVRKCAHVVHLQPTHSGAFI